MTAYVLGIKLRFTCVLCLQPEIAGSSSDSLAADVASYSMFGRRETTSSFQDLRQPSFVPDFLDSLSIKCPAGGQFD